MPLLHIRLGGRFGKGVTYLNLCFGTRDSSCRHNSSYKKAEHSWMTKFDYYALKGAHVCAEQKRYCDKILAVCKACYGPEI